MIRGRTTRLTGRLHAPMGVFAAVAIVAVIGTSAPAQSWQNDIDYAKLKTRLAGQVPTGAGGILSMVEGTVGGASYVNAASPEFNGIFDPNLLPVQFTDGSGAAANGNSNHALGVARHFFGDLTSIAPGANQAVLYEAGHWLSNGALHYDNNGGVDNGAQPEPQLFRVQNHSYVVTTLGSAAQDQSALRRYDWIIENDDVTAVVGANNASSFAVSTHPSLWIHSYNAIVVGRTDGFHSRGATGSVSYGTGRFKPDIVAPFNLASHASPVVGSVAALLHESGAGTDAVKSETMKATLLAGATKQEFANFLETMPPTTSPPTPPSLTPKPWDRTPTRPLDDVFGAGEVNAYNSYLIQLGGQHAGSQAAPTTIAGSYGWDYKGKTSADELFYNFEIAEGSSAEELSIILAWNAKITDTNPAAGQFTPVESLQNLDLQFFDSSGSFLGNMLDQSISTVDNVEHIYQTNLGPGTYTLKVSGAADWDYGLAWRMTTKFDHVSADFNGDSVVDGADLLTWQRNFGTLLGAAHSEGDADGDGDVDVDDLAAVENRVLPPPQVANLSVAAIPEPTALALAAGTLLVAAGWSLRHRRRG